MRLFRTLALSAFLLSSTLSSIAAPFTPPIIDSEKYKIEAPTAIAYDPATRKVYVGGRSRDPKRLGLYVFDVDADGKVVGEPRRYSDHTSPLPADQWSLVSVIAIDKRHNKLFLSPNQPDGKLKRPLVMYNLDAKGEPTGQPLTFDDGSQYPYLSAVAPHPKLNKLYAGGFGKAGVVVYKTDDNGIPRDEMPQIQPLGGVGKQSLAVRADGSKIYVGTYPYTLEVSDLDANGNLTGKPRSYAIPGGEKLGYLNMSATEHGIYCVAADGNLGYFPLNAQGEPGMFRTVSNMPVQAVATLPDSNRLLIASTVGFTDAVTGKRIVSGTQIKELATDEDGKPGNVVAEAPALHRSSTTALAAAPSPAAATSSLGYGFLGNRFAGLRVRATLVSVQAQGALLPVSTTTQVGKNGYLRFAYSPKYKSVYAAGDNSLFVHPLSDPKKVTAISLPDALSAVAVDDENGLVYAARKDGIVAVRKLDADGIPAATGENIATRISPIGFLALNPKTHLVYVIGAKADATKNQTAGTKLVPLPGGDYTTDAVVDSDHGRLYAVSTLNANQNLWVWKLQANGQPVDPQPKLYDDGYPRNDNRRGNLNSIVLDSKRQKLYIGANPENAKPGEAYIVVHTLDAQGDPSGKPQAFLSPNNYGSAWSLAMTPNGQWLYEAGFGEANVIAHQLNAQGEPSKEVTRWPLGGVGKDQLTVTPDGSLLLAGTHPGILETIRLKTNGSPVLGAQAAFGIDKENIPLGVLSEGESTDWINLDNTLKDANGWALGRLNLTGGDITKSTVKWEVSLDKDGQRQPLRSVTSELDGGIAALFVPRYGTEDIAHLANYVQDSAERYRMYLDRAKPHALQPEERTRQFVVTNGLIGIDSSRAAMNAGLKTMQLIGHNSLQIWNFSGIAPETVHADAAKYDITKFRGAIYNPPSYFDFDKDKVNPASLDKWAAEIGGQTAKSMGAEPKDLVLYHMGDEPGWYFPYMNDEVRKSPMRLAAFRDYLKSKGFTPDFFGQPAWEQIEPLNQSKAKTLPERRLFFWSTRFFAESMSKSFAAATQAMQRQLNTKILTTTNLNNWPGRYYVPSPGVKIANNWDIGPDAAEGMPDWFDIGRKKAVSAIWTEDWFADKSAQNWSMYSDLLRCAAREGGIEFGGYVVGQSAGAMPEGGKYKLMSLFGHGAKATDLYIFGPLPAFGDGWSEGENQYVSFPNGLRMLGKAERLMYPGRPRNGTVAILMPQASQPWDPNYNARYYIDELYGLYDGLLHEHYAIDFVDDFDLENGALQKYGYSALYVTAPNLSAKAQQAALNWAQAGGTVALLPGACAADEYNEPNNLLWSASGATRAEVPRADKPRPWEVLYKTPTPITLLDTRLGAGSTGTVFQTAPLTPTQGKALATFADGKAAVVAQVAGKGRIISYGYWPGSTYANSANSDDPFHLPVGWDNASRRVITAPARFAATPKHVDISADMVEGALLESDKGIAVTLLNWSGDPKKEVTVMVRNPGKVSSVSSIEQGPLKFEATPAALKVKLPLGTVDVLMLYR